MTIYLSIIMGLVIGMPFTTWAYYAMKEGLKSRSLKKKVEFLESQLAIESGLLNDQKNDYYQLKERYNTLLSWRRSYEMGERLTDDDYVLIMNLLIDYSNNHGVTDHDVTIYQLRKKMEKF